MGSQPGTAGTFPATTSPVAPGMALLRSGSRAVSDLHHIRRVRGDAPLVPKKEFQWRLRSAGIPESLQLALPSIARGLGRCTEPDRSSGSGHAAIPCGPARHTAKDRPAAARPRQIAVRGTHRKEEIAATFSATSRTECFTMSGTALDN